MSWADPGRSGRLIPTATRRLVLARDGRRCQLRLARCTGLATEVDHVVPRWRGGGDEPSNLRASCSICNADANVASRPRPPRLARKVERAPGLLP